MQDVIERLKGLCLLLEQKISENDSKTKQLSVELSLARESTAKNNIKAEELIAREDAVSDIEDIILLSDESKARLNDANKVRSENIKEAERLALEKKEIEKKSEEFKSLMALYREKNASLEAEKVQLEIDRKEMRAKILEDLKKLK
jgi:hypothetical protein